MGTMKFLVLGISLLSISVLTAENNHILRGRDSRAEPRNTRKGLSLLPRGTVQSTLAQESTPTRSPTTSQPPSPRPAGGGIGASFNPAAEPRPPGRGSKSIDQTRPAGDSRRRLEPLSPRITTTDSRARERGSVPIDQNRPAQNPRPRVEPLSPKLAAAVNKMPKLEGNGIETMPPSPFTIPSGARKNPLLARPVLGSPPRSPRGSPMQSQLNTVELDSPPGTPRSSQKGNLDSTIFDTPASILSGSPRRGDQTGRTSFAFESAQPSSSNQQRLNTPEMELPHSFIPLGTKRSGSPKAATLPGTPPPGTLRSTLPGSPTNRHGDASSDPPSRMPPNLARVTPTHSGHLPPTAEHRNRWRGWADQVASGLGAQAYYGESNPGAISTLAASGVAAALTVGGVALSATHVAGHAVAGPLVVASGVSGALAAQVYGHVNNVRNHANTLQLNMDQLRDRGRQTSSSIARGTSNTFRAPMRSIAASGRALSNQLRAISSVPADMHTMASLRR
ncbi:MAG: hypothetical protein GOMPHAMPRED_000921 [Gomphillus americanus]|uniref:Uncharacterized protein n=1 Tax=Gomphillus americanus TaxID=1940652 RepID=A0A8H3F358_9LECA|nr:MAG: hypothetical protein GOMPHAMPRED_000921 [Gomphillus americanus]